MEETSKTISSLVEIKVTYMHHVKASERHKISSSSDAVKLLRQVWSSTLEIREEFYILLLNRSNRVLGWYRISQGGLTGTVVDPVLIFAIAVKTLAKGIILAHNHPSGRLEPSDNDRQLTKKLQASAEMLDIQILDHLILTTESYYSFVDEGILSY
jgi:DNA repair protein RadC